MGATGLAARRCFAVRADFSGCCIPATAVVSVRQSGPTGDKVVQSGEKGSWGLSWLLLTVPKDQPGIDSMSLPQTNEQPRDCPPVLADLRHQLHQRLDQAID